MELGNYSSEQLVTLASNDVRNNPGFVCMDGKTSQHSLMSLEI